MSRNPKRVRTEEEEATDVAVPVEGLVEEPVAVPVVVSSSKSYYCLLINDRVQKLGKSLSPQGDWYYVLLDMAECKMFGPHPLLVSSKGRLEPISGFVQLPVLTDLVYNDMRRMGKKGLSTEPPSPIHDLGGTKMMSATIHIDW